MASGGGAQRGSGPSAVVHHPWGWNRPALGRLPFYILLTTLRPLNRLASSPAGAARTPPAASSRRSELAGTSDRCDSCA